MALQNVYSRTDLALECEPGRESSATREYARGNFSCTELTIGFGEEEKYGKKAGRYVTMSPGKLWMWEDERADEFACALADELRTFVKDAVGGRVSKDTCVLVCGLGNRFITPDALGPLTLDKITVTRHALGKGGILDSLECSQIAAFAPGTLGQTGIEALELVRGAAHASKPDVVIVIDALAARSTERLCSTVQLSDGGISPGSGIGNSRKELSRDTLGVPVIAMGVPTVVDSSTLVYDVLEEAGVESFSDSVSAVLEGGRSFFVSPKECDVIIDSVSSILASAIEKVFGL